MFLSSEASAEVGKGGNLTHIENIVPQFASPKASSILHCIIFCVGVSCNTRVPVFLSLLRDYCITSLLQSEQEVQCVTLSCGR